jgi:hypothetical protein
MQDDHPLPTGVALDGRANGRNHAYGLMPENPGWVVQGIANFLDIGLAKAHHPYLNQYLIWPDLRYRNLFVAELIDPPKYLRLHVVSSTVGFIDIVRDLLFNKIPVFAWRGGAAPPQNWDLLGFYFMASP